MAKTGSEYEAVIRQHLGGQEDDDVTNSTTILNAVNAGIYRVASKYNWRAMKKLYSATLPTDDYKYTLPARTKDVLGIWILESGGTTGYPVQYIATERKDNIWPHTSSSRTGRPDYYGRYANWVWFDFYPDQEYTLYIRVSVWPPKINASTEDIFDERVEQVIEAAATARLYRGKQEHGDADSWEAYYKELYEEQKKADEYEPDWSPKQTPRGFEYRKPSNFDDDPLWRHRLA